MAQKPGSALKPWGEDLCRGAGVKASPEVASRPGPGGALVLGRPRPERPGAWA